MNKVGYDKRYEMWLGYLDEWCAKHHGLTRKQAISILFEDTPYNPNGKDIITQKELYWSEWPDYYKRLLDSEV